MLKLLYDPNNNGISETQVGIDEAGKGCMFGPIFAAAVIWNNDIPPTDIKDSKLLSRKKRAVVKEYIEKHALAYGVGSASHEEIDKLNIQNANYLAMHRALNKIEVPYDRICIDGICFKPYKCKLYSCIIQGDRQYVNIAAASILAKEYHDQWINEISSETNVEPYDLLNNKGYGTKKHLQAIKDFGITDFHRLSFCKKYI